MWTICGKRRFQVASAAFLSIAALFLSGCENDAKKGKSTEKCAELPALEYSKNLKIGTTCGEKVAEIRSIIGRDTLTHRFVLQKKASELPPELKEATVLNVPLQNVVTLSSAQIGYMLRLGVQDRIVAVGEGRYIADSALYASATSGKIAEVENGGSLNLEKAITLKPDLIMTFATGGSQDDYERINALGLPLMLTSEWQEDSPLAKAEWIKLFGALFGVEGLADSIFEQSKNAYMQEAREVVPVQARNDIQGDTTREDNKACPRVLVGMSYGGVWYAPGGNSFTAKLIKDAGGCYLWAADTSRELQFSLEEIMLVADSADVWVNPGMFATPDELLAAEPRVKYIKAFRDKRVCQNDGRKGPGGGNDFYESAVAKPVKLLKNLRDCIQNATNGADSTQREFDWYHNIFIF